MAKQSSDPSGGLAPTRPPIDPNPALTEDAAPGSSPFAAQLQGPPGASPVGVRPALTAKAPDGTPLIDMTPDELAALVTQLTNENMAVKRQLAAAAGVQVAKQAPPRWYTVTPEDVPGGLPGIADELDIDVNVLLGLNRSRMDDYAAARGFANGAAYMRTVLSSDGIERKFVEYHVFPGEPLELPPA